MVYEIIGGENPAFLQRGITTMLILVVASIAFMSVKYAKPSFDEKGVKMGMTISWIVTIGLACALLQELVRKPNEMKKRELGCIGFLILALVFAIVMSVMNAKDGVVITTDPSGNRIEQSEPAENRPLEITTFVSLHLILLVYAVSHYYGYKGVTKTK